MPVFVSKTDLTRRTRDIVDLAQQANVVIVKSYGDECVVLLDILTYRLLTAFVNNSQHVRTTHIDSTDRELPQTDAAFVDEKINIDALAERLRVSRHQVEDRLEQLGISIS